MRHPELFIVPAFMLSDSFLTLVGEVQRNKKYSEHFKAQHYELNPIWQKSVAQRKWLNPRHLLLTIAVTILVVPAVESNFVPEPLATGLLGGLLVFFGTLIGRHLSNLLIFHRIAREPDEISGQVTMTHALLLSLSLYQYMVVVVPIALIAVLSLSPSAIGGLFGVILLLMVHLRWIRGHGKQRESAAVPDAGAQPRSTPN